MPNTRSSRRRRTKRTELEIVERYQRGSLAYKALYDRLEIPRYTRPLRWIGLEVRFPMPEWYQMQHDADMMKSEGKEEDGKSYLRHHHTRLGKGLQKLGHPDKRVRRAARKRVERILGRIAVFNMNQPRRYQQRSKYIPHTIAQHRPVPRGD